MTMETLFFDSHGVRCEAWFYPPPHPGAGKTPIVIMAHGLGGFKQIRLGAYAERFQAAGYACLVFDYRHFGGSEGAPRHLLDVKRQLQDWRAAIAFARALPDVDPNRVVIWGTSFAGGHVIEIAARDPALAGVISQCPFTDGRAAGAKIGVLTRLRIGWRAVRDIAASLVGAAPVDIPLAGKPGTVALMTAPDVLESGRRLRAASGVDPDRIDRVPARIALQILAYAPGKKAPRVTCPLFVALCDHDSVAPPAVARRLLSRAPRVDLRTYPIGHFDIYLEPAFDRAVADQIAFLKSCAPLPT